MRIKLSIKSTIICKWNEMRIRIRLLCRCHLSSNCMFTSWMVQLNRLNLAYYLIQNYDNPISFRFYWSQSRRTCYSKHSFNTHCINSYSHKYGQLASQSVPANSGHFEWRRDRQVVVKLCAIMWCTVYYAPQKLLVRCCHGHIVKFIQWLWNLDNNRLHDINKDRM